MAMNVRPVPALDNEVNDIRLATAEIVNRDILPSESKLWGWMSNSANAPNEAKEEAKALRQDIQDKVKQAGLWAPHLPKEFGGMGLSFMQHAYMNEVLAYSPGAASLFGVVAPNSGNQKILVKYGTPEQHEQWLKPLTDGTMQSGFSMTEPDNAGSDPRSITTRAELDGDEWAITGADVGSEGRLEVVGRALHLDPRRLDLRGEHVVRVMLLPHQLGMGVQVAAQLDEARSDSVDLVTNLLLRVCCVHGLPRSRPCHLG